MPDGPAPLPPPVAVPEVVCSTHRAVAAGDGGVAGAPFPPAAAWVWVGVVSLPERTKVRMAEQNEYIKYL